MTAVDMSEQARFAMEFCAAESCGKCTPCRVGSVRGVEVIDRIIARHAPCGKYRALLRDLCDTLEQGSLCAMGGLTPMPVRSALDHFPRTSAESAEVRPRSSMLQFYEPEKDYGTRDPLSDETVTLSIDGVEVTVARRYLGDARRRRGRYQGAQAVRHRFAGSLRLLPRLPGGDRGVQRLSLHPAPRRCADGMTVRTQTELPGQAAPQRDGAVHLRSPAGLPDLPHQW